MSFPRWALDVGRDVEFMLPVGLDTACVHPNGSVGKAAETEVEFDKQELARGDPELFSPSTQWRC